MKQVDLTKDNLTMGPLADRIFKIGLGAGGVGTVAAILLAVFSAGGKTRFFESYLIAYMFFLSLSLGALFFVLIHHRARSGWSVVIRRIGEALAANFITLAVLLVPILVGFTDLYTWSNAEVAEHDHLIQHKHAYLNLPFFLVRMGVYFAVWIILSQYFFRRSLDQDTSRDPKKTQAMEKVSAPGILLFALTLTFASIDLIMTRDPHWFSTMFGVYYFSGCLIAIFATMPILLYLFQRSGRLTRAVSVEHYHDIGKYLFGFVVFWAYIAFSQFMLIWYANIPEETVWYLRRQNGDWLNFSLFLMVGHFFIPFALLISRYTKRRPFLLSICAAWLLFLHWVDLYWLIMPESTPAGELGLSMVDLATMIGVGGFYFAGFGYWLRDRLLIPAGDPRLAESLAFENA